MGAATTFVLYLLARSVMGSIGALAAASFWAFSPLPIALNRLLKEETPLVFFSLLGCYFYMRAKEAAQESQFQRRLDLSAIAFGLSFASKYAPQLFGLNALAWYIARGCGVDSRDIGSRFLRFFALIAITFVVFNPVIVVPANVQSMLQWMQHGGAHHTGYNLAGTLYFNQPSFTQTTVPMYFYAWLVLVKTPLLVLAAIVAGSVLLLRRRDSLNSAFFLSFGLVQFIGLSAFPGKWIRYVLGVLPFLFLAGGYATEQLYEWLSQHGVTHSLQDDASHQSYKRNRLSDAGEQLGAIVILRGPGSGVLRVQVDGESCAGKAGSQQQPRVQFAQHQQSTGKRNQ